MKSFSLYEMSDQYQFLLNDLYDNETGVVDETALDKLNALQDTIENKCINITKIFKSIELTQESIKAEKERLAKREKAFKNQVERLKEYLKSNMERCNINRIDSPEFTIAIQNNPKSVEIMDINQIPEEYNKIHQREIDLKKISDDLKKGIEVPGVKMVQKHSLRIR